MRGIRSVVLLGVIAVAACAEIDDTAIPAPTAPSVLVSNPNYAGEWAGGWRTISCQDLPPQFGYCANNVRRDFEPLRLVLTQAGARISGTIQTNAGHGNVGGVADDLGRLRIGGLVMSVATRGAPAAPRTRIVAWRTVSTSDGFMIGGIELEHLWGDLNRPAARAVAELTDTLLKKCAGPKFTGLYWEC